MRPSQLLLLAVPLLLPSYAQAGIKLTYERKSGDKAKTHEISVEGPRLRLDGVGGGERGPGVEAAVIIDTQAKKLIVLNLERKTYNELTEAQLNQMKEQMGKMKERMAEQMKTLPPEQRQHMEQMMKERMPGGGNDAEPPEVKYEPTGQKKKISGYACEVYRVSIGGALRSESCFAPWGSGAVTAADAEQFKKLSADVRKMMAFTPAARLQDWGKAPGIAVEESHLDADGKVQSVTTLKSITRGALPDTLFQVPAGFTQEDRPHMGPPGMGPGMGPPGMGPGMGPGGPHGPPPGPGTPPR